MTTGNLPSNERLARSEQYLGKDNDQLRDIILDRDEEIIQLSETLQDARETNYEAEAAKLVIENRDLNTRLTQVEAEANLGVQRIRDTLHHLKHLAISARTNARACRDIVSFIDAALSGDSSAPKRHRYPDCDCIFCQRSKKYPQIPHHDLCGCGSCTHPAVETKVSELHDRFARAYNRLQCADVPRGPWHIEVGDYLLFGDSLMESAVHASVPRGCKCADCSIDGEACPACYAAWWSNRHPNVTFDGGSAQETSEQPATEDGNWQNGFLACAAMFESGQVSNLRETVAKINRAKKASIPQHMPSSFSTCTPDCPVCAYYSAQNGRGESA